MPKAAAAGTPSPPITAGARNQTTRSTRPAGSSPAGTRPPPSTLSRGRRPAADQDGVVLGTQQMAARARRLAGDPAAGAVMAGDAAVERACDLQGDEWPALGDAHQEAGIERGSLVGEQRPRDRDAGGLELG